MKKMSILLILSASITFAGCSKEPNMPTDIQTETVPVTINQETLRQVEIIDLEENDAAEIGAECFAEYGITRDEDNYCSIQLNSKPIISAQSGNGNKIELYLRLMDRMKGTIRKVTIGEYMSDMPILEDTNLFTFTNDIIMVCRAGDTYIIVTYDKISIAVYEGSVAIPIKNQQPVKILEILEKDL